jgi:NADPH:quinone reductase-like Zn-dependent oxidoreductase
MRALTFATAGDPLEVLRLAELPAPCPAANEALVEVSARPVHPADHAFIRGQYRVQPVFPQVAGLEGVGKMVECPPNSGFDVGQRCVCRSRPALTSPISAMHWRPMPKPAEWARFCWFKSRTDFRARRATP